MKNGKKVLLIAVCAVLLVVASVMGTLAYLTDSETVANTFTVGKVEIDLNETDTDGDGSTKKNEYKLIPGIPMEKDPTVTIKADSESSYVYMVIEAVNMDALTNVLNQNEYPAYWAGDVFLLQNLCDYEVGNGWNFVACDDNTYRFVYESKTELKDADYDLPALFTEITLPGAAFGSEDMAALEDVEINVTAYAIQEAGFTNADEAWTALKTQHSLTIN